MVRSVRLTSLLFLLLFASLPAFADTSPVNADFSITFISTGPVAPGTPLLNGSGDVQTAGAPLPMTNGPYSSVVSTDPAGYNVTSGFFYFNGELFALQPNGRPGDYFKRAYGIWGDDVLYAFAAPNAKLDGAGLAFLAVDGSQDWLSIFSFPGNTSGDYYIVENTFGSTGAGLRTELLYESYGQFVVTPEPSTFALLGSGVMVVAVWAARRRRAGHLA